MRTWIAALAALALLTAGCGAQPPPPPEEYVSPIPRDEGADVIAIQERPLTVAEQMAGQTGVIEMVITDQGLSPAHIAVYAGEPVKLHVRNEGSSSHNFAVPRFGVYGRYLAPGEENYIEFTPTAVGNWPYFAEEAAGQPAAGLRGILKVE